MIAKLKGLIDSAGEDWAIIDVAGVGYLVFCSRRTLGRLGAGEAAELLIETHVREDHIHLYGFFDALERDWFKLLTTVQGVGVKVALGMLSVLSPDQLTQAIAAADKGMITQAPGVGPKLATRILSELKDKVGSIALGSLPGAVDAGSLAPGEAGGGAIADAASALVNLGYQPSQALSAVSRTAGKLGGEATVEALIRGGLGELAPMNAKGSA
ncbi:MAG: Holliday junction branch migration protein RuvA [Rhodospirillales bacterium]|nr:Holliday junction branch migration protein RuvA [Alphaproteobacteria bacterium]MBL6947904.1 Holliday junction branch migration protein RuvA [Rhodospirillales bacterium]